MRHDENLNRKLNVLQKKINEDVEKKHVLELRINDEFKALKKLEVSIEKGMEVQQKSFLKEKEAFAELITVPVG